MSSWVVPGRVRQSTSTSASPGITLYLMPAWMIVRAERVAQQRAQDRGRGSGRTARRSRPRPGAGRRRVAASRSRRWSGGRAARDLVEQPPHHRRDPRLARASRGGGRPRRRGPSALSSRGIEPWPQRPRDVDPVDLVALLRDLDRVEAAARRRRRYAARLVERGRGPEQLRPVVDDPADALPAAGLLVRGGGEQDVAAEAGDRVAWRGRGRRRGRARRAAAGRPPRARPSPSCRPRRAPRRSRRRRRRRTGRASSPRGAAGTTSRWREEQQRVAAGAVAAEAGDHRAAAGERLQDLGRQAERAQLGGDPLGGLRAPGRAGRAG